MPGAVSAADRLQLARGTGRVLELRLKSKNPRVAFLTGGRVLVLSEGRTGMKASRGALLCPSPGRWGVLGRGAGGEGTAQVGPAES